jgi:phospholipid/cholesterol/gamma-HCH transport system substrate-binding protein
MKIRKEVKIGFFVLVVIILFIWGYNFLKGKDIFTRTNEYYLEFANVVGLKVSNPVLISGYKVGTVHDIYMKKNDPARIVVEISIERHVNIPLNTIGQLSSDLLGSKSIKLKLGNSTSYHKEFDTLRSAVETDLMEQLMPLKEKVENAVVSIDSLIDITRAILNEKTAASIRNSFANIEGVTESLNAQKARIDAIFANLQSISGNLKANNEALSNVITNFSSISDSIAKSNIKQTIEKTHLAVSQTYELMRKINNGEGSLGMLANNDTLYFNLESASKNLDLLIEDLRNHPKRYVHFSVFGKKDKTEPVK